MIPVPQNASPSEVLDLIWKEYCRAKNMFPRNNASPHEGYAILKEEVDELWDDIKANNLKDSRGEALQVAAMALRYILETKVE